MASEGLIAAGISAAGGVASAGVNALATHKLNKRQVKFTKKLMDYQQDINLANWNLQNAYNHPAEQVKRLKQAGLNPNLLYGTGSASTGNAGDIGDASAPSLSLHNPDYSGIGNSLAGALSLYQNWQLNKANLAHINADRERLSALTSSEMYRQTLMAAETSGKNLDNAIKDAAKNDIISSYKADLDLKREQKRSIQYQADVQEKTRQTLINQAEINLLKSKGELMLQKLQSKVLDANASNLVANARLAGVNASLGTQQFDWIDNYGYSPGSAGTPSGVIGGLSTKLGSDFSRRVNNAWNTAAGFSRKVDNWVMNKFKRKR